MTFADDEYGRRAFEFVERLQQAVSSEEIARLIVAELEQFGLTSVSIWKVPGPGESSEGAVSLNTRPEAYIEHYIANDYINRDPVMAELRRNTSPFSWTDIKNNRRLSKADLLIMSEGREFGADEGFVVPIVSLSGATALFSPCGKDPDLSARARQALEIIAVYGYQILQRALIKERRNQNKNRQLLTTREREVMKWVATGKSDDEIGDILGIGTATVKCHVNNAKWKLDAVRRTYAVVQALRFGEISL